MGDFSRDTFDKMKHYVGVRLQQGVPLVDADWNEMEDIRKFELQAFIKWFVGDGVLNDGFRIEAIPDKNDDFVIKGGDGARCLVEGIDVIIDKDVSYQKQDLYINKNDLDKRWDVDVVKPLTIPKTNREDLVYLDVWEREVDSKENPELVLPGTKIVTCVRLKREWAVRVAENTKTLPVHPKGHVFYLLSYLVWSNTGNISNFDDKRQKIGNDILLDEIIDARGIKDNLGSRLDESLNKKGELEGNVVGNYQVDINAAIEESKIQFSDDSGHDHSGGSEGKKINSNDISGIIPASKIHSDIARDGEVQARFDTASGHDHEGTNSKKIKHSSLDLESATNPHNIKAAGLGALLVSDYDFRNSSIADAIFTSKNRDGYERPINTNFKPKFLLVTGGIHGILNGGVAGNSIFGFADLRGNTIKEIGSGFQLYFLPEERWRCYATTDNRICHGRIYYQQNIARGTVSLSVSVSNVYDVGFDLKLHRSGSETEYFKITLKMFCFG